MVIKEDIIDQYLENRLEFHIPNLELKNSGYRISGSGTISLNHLGAFEIRVYSKKQKPLPFDYFITQYNKSISQAGKLISKEDFFALHGKNHYSTHYSCKQLQVFSSNENITKGTLKNSIEICSPDKRIKKYNRVEIIINSNLKIPVNNSQRTKKEYPDGSKFENLSRNTFLLNKNGTRIIMFNNKNYFLINISTKDKTIDYKYLDNIINSLSFLIGKYLRWNIVKLYNNNDDEYKFLFNQNKSEKFGPTLSKPPFDFLAYMEKPEYQEQLFLNYFKFVSTDKKCILYKITIRNLLASYSYLHVFSLTLSANIEELLKVYFKKYAKSILKPKDVTDAMTKINNLDIKEQLQNRIIGFLNNIKSNIHINDIFKTLVTKKLLSKEDVEDWKKLRNSSAHGDITNNFDTQGLLDLVYRNLVLYHKIIFLLIGYKGLYSNYGLHGHPSNSFDVEI